MRAVELIERKRDGAEHAPAEISWLIDGYCRGVVAPEQMSAWAMAVVFRGLSDAEAERLDKDVAIEVEDAITFAESSPEPPLDSLYENVYS